MFTKNKQLLSSEKSFLRGPVEHGSRPSDREGGILTTGSETRVVSEKMKVVEPSFHVVHDTGAKKEMVTMVGRGAKEGRVVEHSSHGEMSSLHPCPRSGKGRTTGPRVGRERSPGFSRAQVPEQRRVVRSDPRWLHEP